MSAKSNANNTPGSETITEYTWINVHSGERYVSSDLGTMSPAMMAALVDATGRVSPQGDDLERAGIYLLDVKEVPCTVPERRPAVAVPRDEVGENELAAAIALEIFADAHAYAVQNLEKTAKQVVCGATSLAAMKTTSPAAKDVLDGVKCAASTLARSANSGAEWRTHQLRQLTKMLATLESIVRTGEIAGWAAEAAEALYAANAEVGMGE